MILPQLLLVFEEVIGMLDSKLAYSLFGFFICIINTIGFAIVAIFLYLPLAELCSYQEKVASFVDAI
jgi:hypothetical protein